MKSVYTLIFAAAFCLLGLPAMAIAADADKAPGSQQGSAKKPSSGEQKQKRSDTGPQGEEQTGGAGPSGPSSGPPVKAPQHEGAGSKPSH